MSLRFICGRALTWAMKVAVVTVQSMRKSHCFSTHQMDPLNMHHQPPCRAAHPDWARRRSTAPQHHGTAEIGTEASLRFASQPTPTFFRVTCTDANAIFHILPRTQFLDCQCPACSDLRVDKMAASSQTPRKILARDIVAFTDEELDRYLAEHTQQGGEVVIAVADHENLPESFLQRLR